MRRMGVTVNTEYDRPEGDEYSIICKAEEIYDYAET